MAAENQGTVVIQELEDDQMTLCVNGEMPGWQRGFLDKFNRLVSTLRLPVLVP